MKGTREVCTPHAQRRLRRWTTRLLFGSLVLVAAGCRTPVAEEVAAVLAKGAERTALERTLGEPVSEREESLGTRAVYRYRYETYARREWSERVGREMFSAGRSAQGGLAEVVLASTVVLPHTESHRQIRSRRPRKNIPENRGPNPHALGFGTNVDLIQIDSLGRLR